MTRLRDEGTALVERVRAQVDTREGLDRLRGRQRRMRLGLAVAAVLAVVVGTVILVRPAVPPAAGPSSPTDLPVTVSLALLDEFARDGEAGCVGLGVHGAISIGTRGTIVDSLEGALIAPFTVTRPGEIIDAERGAALGLPTTDEACLFTLATVRTDIDRLGGSLLVEGDEWTPSSTEFGAVTAGQQFVYYSRGSP